MDDETRSRRGGVEELAARRLQYAIEFGVTSVKAGGCKFLAQHWSGKSFDLALLRELVGETVAAEDSVDGLAKLVSAAFDVEMQVIVVEEIVIPTRNGLADTPPAELDGIEHPRECSH